MTTPPRPDRPAGRHATAAPASEARFFPRRRAAREVKALKKELDAVRQAYTADWLRTNKWPNIEVSLRVYEEVGDSYSELLKAGPAEAGEVGRYRMLDLSRWLNRDFMPVSGVPIGRKTVNGVPFLFPGPDRTHAALTNADGPVELSFPPTLLADVHLIIAVHKGTDEPHPAVRVELLRGGQVVFTEELLNITHLCDWWAPLGEHIWAGGGMAYVDPARVKYALKPGHMYGLTQTSGFALPIGLEADGLRIRGLTEEEIRLFAVTVEAAGH